MNLLPRSSIQAVWFDLDGIVIDSEPVDEHFLKVAGERLGHQPTLTEPRHGRG
jgi:beta-phosphoglucomutase-like phosphatase (HAD superfamily)